MERKIVLKIHQTRLTIEDKIKSQRQSSKRDKLMKTSSHTLPTSLTIKEKSFN